jgi:hypothetical protein
MGSPSRERKVPERGLFLGLSAGMSMPSYNTDGTDIEGMDITGKSGFGGTLFFGMDFGRLIGQVEVLLVAEKAIIDTPYGDIDIEGMSLLVPFVFKADFHLGPLVLQPLAGLYLNFALGDLKESGSGFDTEEPYANPLLGLMLGGSFGITLGRGILFLDGRYAMDLGRTVAGSGPITIWKRSAFMFNLGYQFSLGRRR